MSLFDVAGVRRNVDALVRAVGGADVAPRDRISYFECLNAVQKHPLRYTLEPAKPMVEFSLDEPLTAALFDELLRSPDLVGATPEVERLSGEEIRAFAAQMAAADRLMDAYNPACRETWNSLVAQLFVVRKPGYCGGSIQSALGAVWMSPAPAWEPVDYAENMIHEAVHQVVCLDDMVNGLFAVDPDALARPEALIPSAIRGVERPYDFSFHAATVAVELMQFDERSGYPERAATLCRSLLPTLAELDSRRALLTPHGARLLDRMLDDMTASSTFGRLRDLASLGKLPDEPPG